MLTIYYAKLRLIDIVQINPPRPTCIPLTENILIDYIDLAAVSGLEGQIAFQKRALPRSGSYRRYFQAGDVLFPRIASGIKGQKILEIGVEQAVGMCSQEFSVIRPDLNRVMPRYLFHWLQQQSCKELIRLVEGTTRKRIPSHALANTLIWLQPIFAQDRCVQLMDVALKARRLSILQAKNIESLQRGAWRHWLGKFQPAP
jgi:hypothetical protein